VIFRARTPYLITYTRLYNPPRQYILVSNTTTIMAISQQDQPLDNASTHDGFDGEDKASNATDSTTKDPTSEDVTEYPPPAQGAMVMLALLLALFLSALVSHRTLVFICDINSDTHQLTPLGPHNHRDRHSSSHRRI
jgi:hypothetical protein